MDYKGLRILITGGTGSCGHQLIHRLLADKPKEIVVFSRDEKKHYDLKYELRGRSEMRFMIGDIRDAARIREATEGIDIVFHTAAMKHVTQCEENVLEAIKTNVLGTKNVIDAALACKVKRVVALSTDKAVQPVNAMGMTKALAERLITEANFSPANQGTKLCCVRYGNVMNSRGSAIPFFRHVIAKGEPVPITDAQMTRFMLTLNEAIELVLYAAEHQRGGEVFVRKAPAVYIKDLAEALCEQQGVKFTHKIIGTFPGEKIHEVLVAENEKARAEEHDRYWVIHADRLDTPKRPGGSQYWSKDEVVGKEQIPELLSRADSEARTGHFELDTFQKPFIS